MRLCRFFHPRHGLILFPSPSSPAMKAPVLLCASFLILYFANARMCAQTPLDTLVLRIASYNVENLFDYEHDSLKNDYEFLPDATRHWNYSKYKRKLDNLARTIVALGGWNLPALIALCEVENDRVMRDLTRYSALREAGYRYIMTHSADERGIDVSLIYQRGLFKPLHHQSIPIPKPTPHSRPTRDILHVCGLLPNLDTLDIFVAHFPSRAEGAKRTEPYRIAAAHRLKAAIDSLCRQRKQPQIIVMGDFNDYPASRSIREILEAKLPPANNDSLDDSQLYHLLARKALQKRPFWQYSTYGSYKYQGEWGLLDHIIVSGNLLRPSAPFHTKEEKAGIYAPPFLLTDDKKYGGKQPFRTYYGMRYQRGYSDHLPVYADFQLIY